jgi:GT2 family glycosyltransferase
MTLPARLAAFGLPARHDGALFAGQPESFELVWASPALDPSSVRFVVCVPTFRRPDLLEQTLRSLASQTGAPPFTILVVENDGIGREGAARASEVLAALGVSAAVIVEPRQGNCKAYNALWRFALSRFGQIEAVLGIDDDELASEGWLAAHVAAAATMPADIIGGSVTPIFEDAIGETLRAHPIFRSHYGSSGPVPMIYSSANYLIRANVLRRMGYPFLDEGFDFTGGGDTDFFTRARAAGIGFGWCQEAAMTEIMPARRTQLDWIRARGVRNGQISALIARKRARGPIDHLKRFGHSLALLAASPLRALWVSGRTGRMEVGLYHILVAWGRITAEFGQRVEQYRQPEKN